MEINISEKGKLEINIHGLLEHLSPEAKIDFIDRLSCENAIIRHVADQIFEGATEFRSCGGDYETGPEPTTELGKARREVWKNADRLSLEEIDRLQRQLKYAQEKEKEYSDWAWKMWHAWPEEYICSRPEKQNYNQNK